MITEFQKRIYNTHLRTYRLSQGKPYTLKKNFESMEEYDIGILNKLSNFFTSYPAVDMDTFFEAPYKLYPDESYNPIEFFITARARKIYTDYVKFLETTDPDSPENLAKLQKSLSFVYKYCRENGIELEEYQKHCPDALPVFIDHLKNHSISFYTLHALTFGKIDIESQILDFIFGNFYITYQKTKNKFYSSKLMLEFSKKAKEKITNKLKIK